MKDGTTEWAPLGHPTARMLECTRVLPFPQKNDPDIWVFSLAVKVNAEYILVHLVMNNILSVLF